MPLSAPNTSVPKSKRTMRLLTISAFIFLLFHFVMTLVYCFPNREVPETFRQVSNEYMVPFFHQGWQLFAPDVPLYYGKVYFKSSPAAFDTAWIPFGAHPEVSEHGKLDYAANRMSLMLMADMKRDLYFEGDSIRYDLVQNGRGFLSFIYYAGELQRAKTGVRPDSIQVKLEVIYPENPSGEALNDQLTYIFPWFELN